MSPGQFVVFAKRPAPGHVKTRLCPPFTPVAAAEFYAEMLGDVLLATERFCEALDLEPVLAVDPPEACAEMSRSIPARFRVVPQQGVGLAERMTHAVATAAAAEARVILLRGSDSPALDLATVGSALEALATHDLALCPDLDGGYGLVALRRAAPGLFDHPMSTERVLDDTLAQADRLGLRTQLLEPRFDIDTVADLARLRAERGPALERLCPKTLAHLDAHALWP